MPCFTIRGSVFRLFLLSSETKNGKRLIHLPLPLFERHSLKYLS